MIMHQIKYQARLKEQTLKKLGNTMILMDTDDKFPDGITLKNDGDINDMCY